MDVSHVVVLVWAPISTPSVVIDNIGSVVILVQAPTSCNFIFLVHRIILVMSIGTVFRFLNSIIFSSILILAPSILICSLSRNFSISNLILSPSILVLPPSILILSPSILILFPCILISFLYINSFAKLVLWTSIFYSCNMALYSVTPKLILGPSLSIIFYNVIPNIRISINFNASAIEFIRLRLNCIVLRVNNLDISVEK